MASQGVSTRFAIRKNGLHRVLSVYCLRTIIFCYGLTLLTETASGQQVVQRGELGRPAQVLDETEQWTTPLEVASDAAVRIYIPDVTSVDWLKRNYTAFQSRGTYELTMLTFYRTPDACRINQTNWGLGDAEHLRACDTDIGYRLRRALVDPTQKTVTLQFAAMVDRRGNLVTSSVNDQGTFRTWDLLDANTQNALRKADALITRQMKIYDDQLRNPR